MTARLRLPPAATPPAGAAARAPLRGRALAGAEHLGEPARAEHASLEGEAALLIGGYGVGNVGDEAILAGLLARHDLWDATVVSADPAQTARLHGVRAVAPGSAAFAAALARARTVVVGGGGLFSAYMGPRARLIPLVARAARRLGKRLEFRAIGAYPGTPWLAARLLAGALRRADHVSVRDASTERYVRSLGVQRPLARVTDPAFELTPCSPGRARAILAEHAPAVEGPFVAFGVRRLRDPAAAQRCALALAGLAGALQREGLAPLFIPFSRHPRAALEDDAAFARGLVGALGAGAVLEGLHRPRDVLGVVREAEAVVAMRYHALLFAVLAGRPVLPLPYDAKCDDLALEAGLATLAPPVVTTASLARRLLDAPAMPLDAPARGDVREVAP